MTDYAWPTDLVPAAMTFYLQPHTGGSESPFSRTTKVYGLSAPRWVCRMSFRGGSDGASGIGAYGPRLDAMIAKLGGRENRAQIYDFRRQRMRGPNWVWNAGNQAAAEGATSMVLTGFGANAKKCVLAGDYVGGDGRPHLVTDDADADGSGNVTISFKPPLAAAIAEDAAVFGNPTGLFRLVSDDAGANPTAVDEPAVYDLEFVEDL